MYWYVRRIAVLTIMAMMTGAFWQAIGMLASLHPLAWSLAQGSNDIVPQPSLVDHLGEQRSIVAIVLAMVATGVIWLAIIKTRTSVPFRQNG